MGLLELAMLVGVAYLSYRSGKSVGQTIARFNDDLDSTQQEQVKEKILIEKIDSVYFAYKQDRFVSQNEDLGELILDAMGKHQGATLVAENQTVADDIRALLDSAREAIDKSQQTNPTH